MFLFIKILVCKIHRFQKLDAILIGLINTKPIITSHSMLDASLSEYQSSHNRNYNIDECPHQNLSVKLKGLNKRKQKQHLSHAFSIKAVLYRHVRCHCSIKKVRTLSFNPRISSVRGRNRNQGMFLEIFINPKRSKAQNVWQPRCPSSDP